MIKTGKKKKEKKIKNQNVDHQKKKNVYIEN